MIRSCLLALTLLPALAIGQAPPKVEPPKVEPGKQDPVTEKPKTDAPKTETPKTETPKPGDKPGDQPVPGWPGSEVGPKSADPADIAAIRSAQAMIEAEKKLAQMIKDGKITGLDKIVTFDELTAWPYEDGLKGMPKNVRELDGKKVLMTGFMLPIDEVQNIKEFLLVQSLWACCYGQPPDINGIVRVVMPKGKTSDYFFDPLKITGRFKVESTVIEGYCVDIFQLHVETIEPIR